jgi:hypothetical protein
MKAKSFIGAAVVCVAVLAGSSAAHGQKLYPVQGPLAQQSPAPVFKGQIRRPIVSLSTNFMLLKSWTVANGEVLNGKCSLVVASSPDWKTPGTSASYPPQPNLAFAWDLIKGQGYYVARVLGNKIAQGVFRGDNGTILQVESVDNTSGVAVDNHGNIYKIVW